MQQMNVHDEEEYAQEQGVDGEGSISGSSNSRSNRLKTRLQNAYLNKRTRYGAIAAFVVLIFIITLSTSLSGKNRSRSGSGKGPRVPRPEVKSSVQQTNKGEWGTFLANLYNSESISMEDLSVEGTPQSMALHWLTGREEYTAYSSHKRTQRYALATFYYATFGRSHDFQTAPQDWTTQLGWLTDEDECTWSGIACDTSGYVVGLRMPSNQLSGSLPMELAFLPHLAELDLTTNFIYMVDDMHNLWEYLINLQVLLLEDNFIVTDAGLPETFAFMVKLQKIQLSYNLLQGALTDDVFIPMVDLQHLEIESNYITGDLPSALGALPKLVYVYARRNLMSISLTNMLPAPTATAPSSAAVSTTASSVYPSLFSLWLDNNVVSTPIPTTIGLLTGLASLSMTNATLAGSLPTELGLLTGLKRVWLYDNALTGQVPTQLSFLTQLEVMELHHNPTLKGQMPQPICESVAASEYALRALTADCAHISCIECCTQCY